MAIFLEPSISLDSHKCMMHAYVKNTQNKPDYNETEF